MVYSRSFLVIYSIYSSSVYMYVYIYMFNHKLLIYPTPASPLVTIIYQGLDTGKDWGQEEKGVAEDETVGWHHPLSGHEFEQTLGASEGQGSLAGSSPWVKQRGTWLSDRTTTLKFAFTSVSLFLFHKSSFLSFFKDSTYTWYCMVFVFDLLHLVW